MMKVLFVISGTNRVAASRYRVYQYLPSLESRGIECRVISSISDLATRLAIRSPEFGTLARMVYYVYIFIERFFRFWPILLAAGRFDIVFLQRATFPFGLAKLLRQRSKRMVFDIDDAIFMPDTPKKNLITWIKSFIKEGELKDTLKASDCVIVENEYIKDYVKRYCDKIYKIPGPIDTDRYSVKREQSTENREQIVIGWIGSPATTVYLHLLDDVFRSILARFQNVKIVLIGAGNYNFPDKRVIKKEWSYETEVSDLQEFDIGVMPMPDDKWTKGKLGCKMLQYMAVGVPPVVSYTHTNEEIIREGENGYLVKSTAECIDKLSSLITDAGLRKRIGEAGRQTVEKVCSVRQNTPRLLEVFNSLKTVDKIWSR
jgi:glycosyltransferase involved in cell wall biosynthesis